MRGPWTRIGTALLTGSLAFAVTAQVRAQVVSSKAIEGRRAELAAAVAARQKQSAELERRLAELRAEFDRITGASGRTELQRLHDEGARLGEIAGLQALTGAGIVVTLADAKTDQGSDSRIQDVDLQAVLNALWAAGAEAVSVNGERVVATTAVRNAGQAVLLNYHVLASPYIVSVIGPADMRQRFTDSDIARRFRGWQEIYGLGFEVKESTQVDVPAFAGGVRVRYARAGGG